MPNITNNGNVGKKGRSGRKSAYQERADALTLEKMYLDANAAEEIKRKIESGEPFSIKDRHVLNALEGDQKAINPIFNKLFPDKTENTHEVTAKIVIVDE